MEQLMTTNKKIATTRKGKTPSRISLFGPPPLIEGEDAAAYDGLYAHASSALRPTDFIGEMLVHDFVDNTWTIFRLRRLQAKILSDEVSEEADREVWEVNNADPEVIESGVFKPVDVDMDKIQAKVIVRHLEMYAKIDHLITIAESRRNATLREIERHRVGLARMVQEKIREVENAEYEVVDQTVAATSTHKKAA
jgi:hypothetical protein